MSAERQVVAPIVLGGRLVAVIAGGEALIDLRVPEADMATVKAMCLFALEIQSGAIEGPYTELRALAYATRAAGFRQAFRTVPRGPRR